MPICDCCGLASAHPKGIAAASAGMYNLRAWAANGKIRFLTRLWYLEIDGSGRQVRYQMQRGWQCPELPSPQTLKLLKALGYLGKNAGSTTAAELSRLPDAKDKIEVYNFIHGRHAGGGRSG